VPWCAKVCPCAVLWCVLFLQLCFHFLQGSCKFGEALPQIPRYVPHEEAPADSTLKIRGRWVLPTDSTVCSILFCH